MAFRKTKFRVQFAALGLSLGACAHQPTASSDASKGAVSAEVPKSSRAPSPLDPAHPAALRILSPAAGSLVEDFSSAELAITNYPVDSAWQGAVVVLNDAVPGSKLESPRGSVRFPKEALREGANLLRAYLVRANGESLKNPEALAQVEFFYKKREPKAALATSPAVLINSPRGSYSGEDAKKILFDCVISNAPLSSRKWRLHYTLNGEKHEISSWDSYFFRNLPAGAYSLKVELVDSTGKVAKAPFAQAVAAFTVEK